MEHRGLEGIGSLETGIGSQKAGGLERRCTGDWKGLEGVGSEVGGIGRDWKVISEPDARPRRCACAGVTVGLLPRP